MDPEKALIGIVIRADGTVPFDHGVHPQMRQHILAHLAAQGHTIEDVPGTKHVRIVNWTPPTS